MTELLLYCWPNFMIMLAAEFQKIRFLMLTA